HQWTDGRTRRRAHCPTAGSQWGAVCHPLADRRDAGSRGGGTQAQRRKAPPRKAELDAGQFGGGQRWRVRRQSRAAAGREGCEASREKGGQEGAKKGPEKGASEETGEARCEESRQEGRQEGGPQGCHASRRPG